VLGGHSIDDPEPKYGMVVIGEVAEDRIVTNAGARPGDALVLTKAIGTGVVTTALKADAAPAHTVEAAVASMVALNAGAAEAMAEVGVHAATDVTGFGLLGHLSRLLAASGVAAELDAARVPLLPGTRELAAAGHVPGGTRRNLTDLAARVTFGPEVDGVTRTLLCDAQTSGGLLVAVAAERTEGLVRALAGRAPFAVVVGRVVEGEAGRVRVR
jgi:selenide,water dikinase